MRKIELIAAVLAVVFFAFNCGPQDEPGEAKQLTVLTWSDYFGSTTLERFTETTGIQVTVDYIDSNEDLVAKLESQPGQYDLVFPSAYAVTILEQKQLLDRINRDRLSNAGNLLEEYATLEGDPTGENAVPYTVSFTALGVNSSQISEEVSGYSFLLRSDLGKTILLLDDIRATIGMALKTQGYSANSVVHEELDGAREVLMNIRPNVHVFASSDLQQLMASGEVGLAYAWSGDILQAGGMNSDIEIVLPEEGALLYIDCMAIPKGAPRPGNAHAFIDHILSADIAAEISNEILYLTPNKAAESLLSADAHAIWDVLVGLSQNPRVEEVQYIGEAIDLYAEVWSNLRIQ